MRMISLLKNSSPQPGLNHLKHTLSQNTSQLPSNHSPRMACGVEQVWDAYGNNILFNFSIPSGKVSTPPSLNRLP
jgi:thiosulfate reductase cytochrome b subunit